ncbi:MAG: immunoglobulin domain-containing protein [Clostridiales bacterium]|nr:immunoglobulin domain-containing protein [Clostridiales bacterium]
MKSLKWMVRRSGVWLALVLWLSAVWTGASAETPVPEEVPMESGIVEMEEDFSETIMSADLPEDLAEGYIARRMPSRRRILRAPKAIGENLTGANQNLYQLMMADILAIAAGTRTSTELSYSFEDIYPNLILSAQDLGLDYLCQGDTPNPALEQAILTWRSANMQINDVLRALLADCPYDLYWYDKTGGSRLSYSYDYSYDENAVTLTGTYYVKLKVSQNYALRTDNGDGTYTVSDFAVDPVYGQGVQAAAQNAQSIVRQYENLDNYNRLLAYKNRIHALTSYNYSAAGNSGLPYGDPWQLIWVFDGNPDTKVVCEGYSKAFKYLNDLSTGSAEVICATGTIDDCGHMWNIVRMEDGRNYMADITNTDSGTVGSPDLLFLVGTQNGSVSAGYVFTVGSVNLSYVYNNTHGFSTEDLTLAPNNYLFYHPGTRVLSLTSDTPSATTLQDVTITGTALTAEHVELHIYAEEGAPEYETVTAQGDTISVVRNWCHSSEPYFELVASYGDGETLVTSLDLNVTAANTFEPLQFHRIPEFLFGTNTALNASFDPLTGAEIYAVSISYENEEQVQQEILYRTFRGDDPNADYSLNLSRSQMPVNGIYRIAVTAAGTDYEQATTQVSFEVTDATVDGDVAILLDRTSMMTGDMLHWWVCAVGAETISVDVWTENGEHLSPVASNEDLVSEYYYWGRHRMEDVSGTVSFWWRSQ